MEFRKVSVPSPENPNVQTEGLDIPVAESIEKWSEIRLEDGTVFRAKIIIGNVVRISDRFDAQGKPVYFINAQPSISIVEYGEGTTRKGE